MRTAKKLIAVQDVKELAAAGQKDIYLEPDVIITPAAKDEAVHLGMTMQPGPPVRMEANIPDMQGKNNAENTAIDPAIIEKIVREVISALPGMQPRESGKEIDASGVILLRGDYINNIDGQEMLSPRESPKLGCGLLTIQGDGNPVKNSGYGEINYILEGVLTLSIDGRDYEGRAGDVFYIPKGTQIVLSARNKAVVFYVASRFC